MKKQFVVLCFMVVVMMLLSFENGIESNGAPIGSTGAPAEETCAKSTCHGDYAINSGSGLLTIDFNNGNATYQPGQTYNITVSMSQQNIARFGFQLAALKKGDHTQAGVLQVVDSIRTQVLAGLNQFAGRDYVTYRFPGTEPFTANLGQWSFTWTAPPTADAGDVIFYYAGVAANNDGTDFGDQVYTKQLELSPALTGIKGGEANANVMRVFPNPVSSVMNVQYEVEQPGSTTIQLYDLLSRKLLLVNEQFDNAGVQNLNIDASGFAAGVHILTVTNGGHVQLKKIIIE